MTTLVTGASGTVGRSLVGQLARAGEPVRAMTPRPGGDPVPGRRRGRPRGPGRSRDPSGRAGRVERLHLFPYPQTATEVVALASKTGVRASGLEWTHLRPGEFAANRLALGGRPSGPSGWSAGRTPTRSGLPSTRPTSPPWPFTPSRPPSAPTSGFEEVSRSEALRRLEEQGGWAAANGPFLLGYEGFSAGTGYPEIAAEELRPLPTVEQVTGRPAASPSGPSTTPATSAAGQPPRRSRRVWTS